MQPSGWTASIRTPPAWLSCPRASTWGINWQYAHQTRTITSTNPVFALGKKNDGYINYVKGANAAGFMKVASAMMSQGIV